MAQIQESRGEQMKKLLLLATTTLFLFSGCAQKGPDATSGMDDVSKAISLAEAKYNVVHKQEIAFQNTKSIIENAKKMLAEGKNKEALALANMAIYEADTALEESQEAEKTWRLAMPQ